MHGLAHSDFLVDAVIKPFPNHYNKALFLCVGPFSGKTNLIPPENMIGRTNQPATTKQADL